MSDPALRTLPSVDAVLRDPRVSVLPRTVALHTTRHVLAARRAALRSGAPVTGDVVEVVVTRTNRLMAGLRPVFNATGVALHTNLGRAPWSPEAVDAAAAVARGCELELELDTGQRGARGAVVTDLLAIVCEAEAALVVNNCAAAVLLALTALAHGKQVVVSRGELVEIGGGFRVPDVIASGGAKLVEVGTTNRTRIADFERAIDPETAILLRVHRSNFRVSGFVEETPRAELVALGRARGLLVVEDAGSGSLDGTGDEPSIRQACREGVDVVAFSGDKLLGGPQCGCLVGRADVIERLRRHPFYRALRVDKVTLAALGATLALHASGRPTALDATMSASVGEVAARGNTLAGALIGLGVPVRVEPSLGFVGGGSLPDQAFPTTIVVIDSPRPDALAEALRQGNPAIVARIVNDHLVLDARTLRDEDVAIVARGVADALGRVYLTSQATGK